MQKTRTILILTLTVVLLQSSAKASPANQQKPVRMSAQMFMLNSASKQIDSLKSRGRITTAEEANYKFKLESLRERVRIIERTSSEATVKQGLQITTDVSTFVSSIVDKSRENEKPIFTQTSDAWPPRDASGHIIPGPIKSGTREQIGAPLYGYPPSEWASHQGRN